MASLTLRFSRAHELRAAFEAHLSKGRAFVGGASDIETRATCDLVVVAPAGASIALMAEVVYVRAEDPGRGVGLALAPLDAAGLDALRALVEAAEQRELVTETVDDAGPDGAEVSDDGGDGGDAKLAPLHERMRALSSPEQQRLATSGTLAERVTLERLYGPNVWEALLKSNRLSLPEVARIARKGTVPRPLIEMIAASGAWLAAGEVQRALLANPRSSSAVVSKVLHAMPRGELARVPRQTAYAQSVRQAAKKMLGE